MMIYVYGFVAVVLIATVALVALAPQKGGSSRIAEAKKFEDTNGIIYGIDGKTGRYIYSPIEGESMACVIGGTGSGKTSSFIIPTLLSCGRDAAGLVIDISGDISKATAAKTAIVYDPDDPDSVPYNIFCDIDAITATDGLTEQELKESAIASLSLQLLPASDKEGDSGRYFREGGQNFLTAGLLIAYFRGCDFIESCDYILKSSWTTIVSDAQKSGVRMAIIKTAQYVDTAAQNPDDKNVGGCKSTCDAAIAIYSSSPSLRRNLRRPGDYEREFSSASMLESLCYLRIAQHHLPVYRDLFRLIVTQCLTALQARQDYTKQVLLVLDELPALGRLEGLSTALSTLRKRHVHILMAFQALSQLREIYGREITSNIMTNTHYKLILDVSDVETQKALADSLQRKTIIKESVTSSMWGQTTRTQSKEKDYLIQPSEFGALLEESPGRELGQCILLYPGAEQYRRLYKAKFFMQNATSRARRAYIADNLHI